MKNNAKIMSKLQMMNSFFWDHIQSCIIGNTQNETFEPLRTLWWVNRRQLLSPSQLLAHSPTPQW